MAGLGCVAATLVVLVTVASGALVAEGETGCKVIETILNCDFTGRIDDVVVDSRVNQFETVVVVHAVMVKIGDGVCSKVELFHVGSVQYTGEQSQPTACTDKTMYVYNVSLAQIPPDLKSLKVEQSWVNGDFSKLSRLTYLKLTKSRILNLDLTIPADVSAEIRLHNVNVSRITNLALTGSAILIMTDSIVYHTAALITLDQASTAQLSRSTFLDHTIVRLLHPSASIALCNMTGLISVEVQLTLPDIDIKPTHGPTSDTREALSHWNGLTTTQSTQFPSPAPPLTRPIFPYHHHHSFSIFMSSMAAVVVLVMCMVVCWRRRYGCSDRCLYYPAATQDKSWTSGECGGSDERLEKVVEV